MTEFLVFRLYGPLAAWGDIAVGEERPTFAHPSKSSVLGLVAAALGIPRDDESAHARLHADLGFGVRIDAAGTLLRDYHTAQVPPQRRGQFHATRRDELGAADLQTILSTREYRCDAVYTSALWSRAAHGAFGLRAIAQALERPTFAPYLGRKSCPPALSLGARVVESETLRDALDRTAFPPLEGIRYPDIADVYWEDPCPSGLEPVHTVTRRDALLSRGRWQFADRGECYATVAQPRAREE